jgi:F0F1-type ATP synthase assembly protein I
MSEDNNKNNKNYYLGYGISFGLIGGALVAVLLGFFLDTPLVWAFTPGFGMLAGIIIGIIMDAKKNEE